MPRSRLACIALLFAVFAPVSSSAQIFPPLGVYVSPTGSTTSSCTPANPCDLATGFSQLDPGEVMRMAGGNYSWTTGPLPIQSNVRIEGGFVAGSWRKDLSVPTTITINPPLATATVGPTTVGYYAGLNLVGLSNVTIADLTLSVMPSGASGATSSRGRTVYAARLEGCSNVAFSRVNVIRGPGSAGFFGATGTTGANGGNALAGAVGSGDNEDACGRGGAGGAGGGGSLTTPGPSACSSSSMAGWGFDGVSGSADRRGGHGGSGGSGGAYSYYHGAPGGDGGFGFNNFATGGAGGGRGSSGDCQGSAGGAGSNGPAGAPGTSFTPGVRPALGPANRDVYFVPGQASSGGDGAGGRGGGGGGGGGGQEGFFCDDGAGSGGGGGGGGGQGGTGGGGGFGGGSSYGLYLVSNGSNVRLTCCTFATGPVGGTGGSGGTGGGGGVGGSRGNGGAGSSEIGAGGNGGTGGAGGAGGRGQDGANGERVDILLQSGTAAVVVSSGDVDGDGREDVCDNCIGIANANQEDDDLDGLGNVCEGVLAVGDDSSPLEFALHAIRPNPTRAGATIRYDLPRGGNVALRVYDAQGRCVRVLTEGWTAPGRRSLSWDARDARGAPVSAGLYFVRLSIAELSATQKLLILRQ